MPINQLETALWLEADRMGLLLQAISQEEFEVQRAAVKNERGQRVDNQPYGRTSETMMKNLYPSDHPYSWPVIGWIEDLDAADLDDLERFFLRWYGPNNATLTIGGDIDKQTDPGMDSPLFWPDSAWARSGKSRAPARQTRAGPLRDAGRQYPPASHRHAVPHRLPQAPGRSAAGCRRQDHRHGQSLTAVPDGWCRPAAPSARLSATPAANWPARWPLSSIQNPSSGETLADMEVAIRETLLEFTERGVDEDDLQKFIAGFESGQIFGMQSVSGKVSNLAAAEVFSGDPKTATDDIKRYASVTSEDVVRTFAQYIADQPAVILSIVPEGQTELAARPQNFDYHSIAVIPARHSADRFARHPGEAPPELRTWEDNFDRSIQPQPESNPLVDLPPIWDTKLANGVRLLAVPNTETPTVTVQASFRDGPA